MKDVNLEDVGYHARTLIGPIASPSIRDFAISRLKEVYKTFFFKAIEGNLIFLIVIEIIIYFQQLIFIDRMLFYKNGIGQLLKQLFSESLTLENIIATSHLSIILGYTLFLVVKNFLFTGVVIVQPKAPVFKSVLFVLYQIHVLEFSIGVVPILLLLCSSFTKDRSTSESVPAVICFVILGYQRLIMRIFEKDYNFHKERILIFDSGWSTEVRILTDLITMSVRVALDSSSIRNLILTVVFLVMQIVNIGFMVKRQLFYTSKWYQRVYVGRISLLVTMAIYLFLSSLSETIYGIVNLEVLLFSVFILIIKVVLNMYQRFSDRVTRSDVLSLENAYELEMKVNHLVDLYNGLIDRDLPSVELQQQMAGHIKGCKDPKCFCRIILGKFYGNWYETYDQKKSLEIGFRKKFKYVSNLDKIVFVENKQLVEQSLKEQEQLDEDIELKTHKEYQKKAIKLLKKDIRDPETFRQKVTKITEIDPDLIVDVVDVGSFHFKAVIYSFLTSMTEKLKSLDSYFLLFSYCHFTLKNFGLVLLKGFFLMYSESFQKSANFYQFVSLHNFLEMSKTELNDSAVATKKWLTEADFGKVFIYLKKVDFLEDLMRKIIREKAFLLNHLVNKDVNLETMVKKGEDLFVNEQKFDMYAKDIIDHLWANEKFIALFINFKLNISQDSAGISKLKEEYLKLKKKQKQSFGLDKNNYKKNTFSLMDKSNVVLVNSIKLNGLAISYFSKNAPHELKLPPEVLLGMNIKEILPPTLREVHDNLVFDYLNRRGDRDLTPYVSNGCLIDGLKHLQLYNIIIKPEVILNDDFYLIAIMSRACNRKSKFIMLEKSTEPVALSENLHVEFPEIMSQPSSIFFHLPLLIDLFSKYFSAYLQWREANGKEGLSKSLMMWTMANFESLVVDYETELEKNEFMENRPKFIRQNLASRNQKEKNEVDEKDPVVSQEGSQKEAFKKLIANQVKWLEKNRKGILENIDRMRETTMNFKLFSHSNNDSYILVELKNMKRLDSKSCRDIIKKIIRTSSNKHLISILRLEVSLIKAVCRRNSSR